MSKKNDPTKRPNGGVTRRGFLGSVGAGAVVAATGVARPGEAVPEITSPDEMVQVALMINGRLHRLLVEPQVDPALRPARTARASPAPRPAASAASAAAARSSSTASRATPA